MFFKPLTLDGFKFLLLLFFISKSEMQSFGYEEESRKQAGRNGMTKSCIHNGVIPSRHW